MSFISSSSCPCHSLKPYEKCCKTFINEVVFPQSPEQLMRSRYTAYTQANMDYIEKNSNF